MCFFRDFARLRVAIAVLSVASFSTAFAQDETSRAAEEPGTVPLTRAVLFSAGVGFFERTGIVDGEATIELTVGADQINDLLKSLVAEDLGGGRPVAVEYASKDPLAKRLGSFQLQLAANPSLADLLRQVRGELLEIDAPERIRGTLVGVEDRPSPVKDDPRTIAWLTLLTDDGLQSVALAEVGRIRLLNPKLDAELRQALATLAEARGDDEKVVRVRFRGEGRRQVRVGCVQAAPLWKTSYRLVLRDQESPRLQGWAIVENTSHEDWSNVEVALVSGRPIAFQMDLYQPLYLTRPTVVPDLFASLMPQVHGGAMQSILERRLDEAAAENEESRRARVESKIVPAQEGQFAADAAMPQSVDAAARFAGAGTERDYLGVAAVARAEEIGELFQYQIDFPVSLARQQSAMLPIVEQAIEAEKVSLFNAATHATRPLLAVRLKNTSQVHLMQGPITLFDGGCYAGDGRIADTSPGAERLVSYAVDLETEVAVEPEVQRVELVAARAAQGVLHLRRRHVVATTLRMKSTADEPRRMLVELPRRPGWDLVAPSQPAESTADLDRFAVSLDAGQAEQLLIERAQVQGEEFVLAEQDDAFLNALVVGGELQPAMREAIEQVLVRRRAALVLQQQIEGLRQQQAEIAEQQNRVRQNMAQLERTSELYRTYVKQLTAQESQMAGLVTRLAELRDELTRAHAALEAFLAHLNVGE